MSARAGFSASSIYRDGKAEGWGGRDRNLWAESALQAIDYQTGKIRWSHDLGAGEDSRAF